MLARHTTRPPKRVAALGAAALAAALGLEAATPGGVAAHAVVTPGEAPAGAFQRYVLRVPNERGSATVRVHIVFPAGVRVISFDEVSGWRLETTSTDGGASFTTATWSGTLPVARFVELGFIGVNPVEAATLVWPVVQTYADGFLAEWTGPPGSQSPASATLVQAAVPPTAEPGPAATGGGSVATALAAAALVLALLSLGLALRPARQS